MENLSCCNCEKEYCLEDTINDFDGENISCPFCGYENKKRAFELYYKYKEFFQAMDTISDIQEKGNLKDDMYYATPNVWSNMEQWSVSKFVEKYGINRNNIKELLELVKLIGDR